MDSSRAMMLLILQCCVAISTQLPAGVKTVPPAKNCNLFEDVSEYNLKRNDILMPEPWQLYKGGDNDVDMGQLCALGDGGMLEYHAQTGKYTLWSYSKNYAFAKLSMGMWPLKDHKLISIGGYRIMAIDPNTGNFLMSDCSASKGKLKISCTLMSEGTVSIGLSVTYIGNDLLMLMEPKTGRFRISKIKDISNPIAKNTLSSPAPGQWLPVGKPIAPYNEELLLNINGNSFKMYAFALNHTDGKGNPLLPLSHGSFMTADRFIPLPGNNFMGINATARTYFVMQCATGKQWFQNKKYKATQYGADANPCEVIVRGSFLADPRDESTWSKMTSGKKDGAVMAEPSSSLPVPKRQDDPQPTGTPGKPNIHMADHMTELIQTSADTTTPSPSPSHAHAATHAPAAALPKPSPKVVSQASSSNNADGFGAPPAKLVVVESHVHHAAEHHDSHDSLDSTSASSESSEVEQEELHMLRSKLKATRAQLDTTEDEVDRLRHRLVSEESRNTELRKSEEREVIEEKHTKSEEQALEQKLHDMQRKLEQQVEANTKEQADFERREAEDRKKLEAEYDVKLKQFREEMFREFEHEKTTFSKLFAGPAQAAPPAAPPSSATAPPSEPTSLLQLPHLHNPAAAAALPHPAVAPTHGPSVITHPKPVADSKAKNDDW